MPGIVSRSLAFLLMAFVAACSGHGPPPSAPLFPMPSAWRVMVSDQLIPPLAADSSRVFVSTRDGAITAVDQGDGGVQWRAPGPLGPVGATDGTVVVRSEEGVVWSLRPRDGDVRWKVETGVAGTLPAVVDGDRVYVAGRGIVALDGETGRTLWGDPNGPEITALPVATGSRVFVGDADGVLRSVDRTTGVTQWSRLTGGALRAPPLVDEPRQRLYVGTTFRRVVALSLDKGERRWEWKVGADVQAGGLLMPDRVVFAAFDAVLWALRPGGNLDWRAPIPSRPLGGPLLVGDTILIVSRESDVVGYSAQTGRRRGSLRTTAEIRTPLLRAGSLVVVGLRDRSVEAYRLPATPPAGAAAPPPAAPAAPVEDGEGPG